MAEARPHMPPPMIRTREIVISLVVIFALIISSTRFDLPRIWTVLKSIIYV
jgi:hypothetical protein